MKRVAASVAIAVVLAGLLTACVGRPDQNVAGWLDHRAGVLSTQTEAEYPEFQYHGYVHVQLDPKAKDSILEELVTDTLAYMNEHDVGNVSVDFGIDKLTFGPSHDGLALWQQVRDVPDVLEGWVAPGEIHLSTLRTTAVGVLAATDDLGADLSIDTYATADEAPTVYIQTHDTYVEPATIHRAASCEPDPVVSGIVRSIVEGDVLSGSLDLCDGIDVQFAQGYRIGAEAVGLRADLDAAGLADFPVTIDALADGAAPPSEEFSFDPVEAPEHHRVEVSPGDGAVLVVLAALDDAAGPLLYDVRVAAAPETADATADADADDAAEAAGLAPVRTLLLSSRSQPAADLVDLLAQAPAASGAFASIRVDGGAVAAIGTLAELPDRVAAAAALQRTDDEIEHVTIAGPNGELAITNTGRLDEIPDVEAIAAALKASGLWQGRDMVILYDNQRADVIDGVSQVLDPSGFNNDDEVLQGFLDAWTALA